MMVYKSMIFINLEDPSMDWEADMNLICRECWNENNEDEWWEYYNEKQWKKVQGAVGFATDQQWGAPRAASALPRP
jgi:hypothetical protein